MKKNINILVTVLIPAFLFFQGCQDNITIPDTTMTLQAPRLTSPTDDSTNINLPITLSWTACRGADSYRLQVSTNRFFNTIVYDTSGIILTYHQIDSIILYPTHFWRVCAINNRDTSGWSDTWNFYVFIQMGMPCIGIPTIDYSGKTYHTVQIGHQCWLKENLDVGVMIYGNQNQTDNGNIEKYCYNDNPINCSVYGGLYQWEEAMQYTNTAGFKGICPQGWHIPTLGDLDTLSLLVRYAGNALEAIGQGMGTNKSGFSALLSGYRYHCCGFKDSSQSTFYWSSTNIIEVGAPYALKLANGDISFDYLNVQNAGLSIRCIKD